MIICANAACVELADMAARTLLHATSLPMFNGGIS